MRSMKNVGKWLSRALLLSSVFTFTGAAAVFADNIGQINTEDAKILTASSFEAEIVTNLENGYPIRILGTEGEFFRITFASNENVYVSREDVTVEEAQGIVNDIKVNVREYPNKESRVLGKVNTDEIYTAKGIVNEWYMIDYSGRDAYIHIDYLNGELLNSLKKVNPPQQTVGQAESSSQEKVYAVVQSSTGLNLRNQPDQNSQVMQVLRNGAVADVMEVEGEWLRVDYNGSVGYVSTEFVSLATGTRPEGASAKADEIIAYAKRFLGTPYKYAGTNLNTGVDCSGFVYSVMKNFGINLNRSSKDMVRNGPTVAKAELAPGDLVFFDTNGGTNKGNISHVGLYIGNGSFIHSSSSTRTWGVVISSLSEDYYIRTYVTACRVLN